jgi:hypothetical protein
LFKKNKYRQLIGGTFFTVVLESIANEKFCPLRLFFYSINVSKLTNKAAGMRYFTDQKTSSCCSMNKKFYQFR